MKKYVIATCICMVSITQVGCARQTGKSVMVDKVRSTTYLNNINTKAARDFIRRYVEAVDPNWYKISDGFIVKFMLNNHLHRAAYDNRGNWMYSIQYYKEAAMPRDIRDIVKRVYYDYNITQIEEIKSLNNPVVYLVHLQDSTTWRNVRVCEGEMETLQVFTKRL